MSHLTSAQLDTLNRKRLAYSRETDPTKRDIMQRAHDALRQSWLNQNYREGLLMAVEDNEISPEGAQWLLDDEAKRLGHRPA